MRKRSGILAAILILAAVPGVWAHPDASGPAEFDIHTDGDLLLIPVKVHGKTYPFVLDTGCVCTVIDISLLPGKPEKTEKWKKEKLTYYKAPALTIGTIAWQATDPVVGRDLTNLREMSGHQFYGLLGMDFLINYAVQIDFDLGKLRLGVLPAPPLGKTTPIFFLDKKKSRPFVVGEIKGWGPEAHLIDTGDIGFGNLRKDLFRALARKGSVRNLGETKSCTIWGTKTQYGGWLEGLALAGGPSSPAGMNESTLGSSDLGLNFWRRYNVTFDFPRQTLTWEKSRWFDKKDEADWSGLTFQRKEKNTVILEIKEGSPGAKAGLKPGDVLVKIDGKDPAQVRFVELWKIFSRKGKKVQVVYLRDRAQYEALLCLDSWKEKRPRPGFLKEEPTNKAQASNLFYRGLSYFMVNDLGRAMVDFDEVARTDPDQVDVYVWRAKIWGQKKESGRALADLSEAIRRKPNDAGLLWERGCYHWAFQDQDKALTDFTASLRLDPRNPVLLREMGRYVANRGDLKQALANLNEAIRLAPADAEAVAMRAVVFIVLKLPENALQDLEKAIAIDPKCAMALGTRGIIRATRGQHDQALADLNKAVDLGYRVPQVYLARGMVFHMQKLYAREIDDLEESLRLDPNNSLAHHGLAWVLATCPSKDIRDGQIALAHASKACQLMGYKHPVFLEALAAAQAECGNFKEAIRWQKEAIEIYAAGQQPNDQLLLVAWNPSAEAARMRLESYEKNRPTRES